MTITTIPPRRVVWVLDWHAEQLEVLPEIIHKTIPNHDVRPFGKAATPRQLLKDSPPSELPWMLVSDKVGLETSPSQESIVKMLRSRSPLSLILLHSFQAYETQDLVPQMRSQRLIDYDVSKTISAPDFGSIVKNWYDRWDGPTTTMFRKYIETCPDPQTHFFPSGDGCDLNLFDIYREMVVGTELGLEAEIAWRSILTKTPISA